MTGDIPIAAKVLGTAAIVLVGVFLIAGIFKAVFVVVSSIATGVLYSMPFFLTACGIAAFAAPKS